MQTEFSSSSRASVWPTKPKYLLSGPVQTLPTNRWHRRMSEITARWRDQGTEGERGEETAPSVSLLGLRQHSCNCTDAPYFPFPHQVPSPCREEVIQSIPVSPALNLRNSCVALTQVLLRSRREASRGAQTAPQLKAASRILPGLRKWALRY